MNFGLAYGFTLLVSFFVVWISSSKSTKLLFLLSDILIALPAFFIKISPFIYWDTNRFANLLSVIRSYNQYGIINGLDWTLHYSLYSTQPLVAFYLWIFSLFKQNGFLFFTTAFLFLISLSLMILKTMKYLDLNKNVGIFIQIMILMLFNFFYEIEGIRNFLSFIIFATALYIDFNTKYRRNKIFCFSFYVLSYMLHPAVLPFILLRVILLINSKLVNCVTGVAALIYTPFLSLILPIFKSISFLAPFYDKTQVYLYGQSNYNSFSNDVEIIITSLILVSLIIEWIIFKKFNLDKYLPLKYCKFYILAILFTIGSFFSIQIYLRSIMLILFLSVPIKAIMFSNLGHTNIPRETFMELYKVVTPIFSIFMFACWYDLCYMKVFL